ncbi:uncharacterized protein LOC117125625 isoform X3 [Brassica rapa]|uniref:uncharacterized protein LOC117125625 isoform X3 n=1 Tax=Brassica campestris TaxID=3711 RepID=UPI00142D6334|nr:uncharacterized protein LOC117125625 isoform X3 [Brassica rapa]
MQSQIGRHLHALDNDIKLHALPEKHHVTQPESWNHHTLWRKTMVMESQTQTLVWLWNGQKHSFTVKPDFSVGSNQKPSAARKELRIQQRQLQQLRASTMAEKVEESLCLEMKL